MKSLDALQISRKLREETSQRLNNLSWQEKLKLFEETKNMYKDKIEKNNILLEFLK